MQELEMRPEIARAYVSSALGYEVSRTSFYRWRKEMGWIGRDYPCYSLTAVEALCHFGRCVQNGYRLAEAKAQTITYLKEQNDA